MDLFNLKVSSTSAELNGLLITTETAVLGVNQTVDAPPVSVFEINNQETGGLELHTFPIGIIDHVVGLVGSNGLFTLTDIPNPEGAVPPQDGQSFEWNNFRISNGTLVYEGGGRWLAFPRLEGSWGVNWTDGSAMLTEDYMPIDILLESAGEGQQVQVK
ncbi:hypothetical protein GGS21DRAFT_489605 [Xylaria nigripes]|nr:hypothetical protein GGS21DRAFT_489605 [Xylaria nigripes]